MQAALDGKETPDQAGEAFAALAAPPIGSSLIDGEAASRCCINDRRQEGGPVVGTWRPWTRRCPAIRDPAGLEGYLLATVGRIQQKPGSAGGGRGRQQRHTGNQFIVRFVAMPANDRRLADIQHLNEVLFWDACKRVSHAQARAKRRAAG